MSNSTGGGGLLLSTFEEEEEGEWSVFLTIFTLGGREGGWIGLGGLLIECSGAAGGGGYFRESCWMRERSSFVSTNFSFSRWKAELQSSIKDPKSLWSFLNCKTS